MSFISAKIETNLSIRLYLSMFSTFQAKIDMAKLTSSILMHWSYLFFFLDRGLDLGFVLGAIARFLPGDLLLTFSPPFPFLGFLLFLYKLCLF